MLVNSYSKLPKNFYSEATPDKIENPQLILFNKLFAKELDFNLKEKSDDLAGFFCGNKLLKNSKPIALAYAGHQFGHFAPQLGDGRALLLGEKLNKNNQLFDISLKGSGKTIFSRNGDGKCPLGPAIREYVVSEFMHFAKISTTRCLSLVKTNELIQRETTLPAAIICRVAKSHIRIGTFEYFAAKGDLENLKILTNYTIKRHYANCENNYLKFLKEVIKNQAKLVSSWLSIGFIHGVLNTDNVSICGQTIDFGPCAFMDEYHENTVFSFIDKRGRYAFKNQKNITLWNLTKFAQSILPLIDENIDEAIKLATKELNKFDKIFDQFYFKKMAKKIGIFNFKKKDEELINNFLEILQNNQIDFTNGFRILSKILKGEKFYTQNKEFKNWQNIWLKRLKNQNFTLEEIAKKMDKINPAIIPRNHIIENIIHKATYNDNFKEVFEILEILRNPFKDPKNTYYQTPPKEHEKVQNTFCGT